MDIIKQVSKQNQMAIVPHDTAVFEHLLSKPFFLGFRHKELDKKCPVLIKGA